MAGAAAGTCDAPLAVMKLIALLTAAALAGGCYEESASVRTYSTAPAPAPYVGRSTGRVVQVQEVRRETRGRPVAGAAAGALLGGVIFRSAGAAVVGAGIGALASSGGSSRTVYEVTVQFDNGEQGVFDYQDWSPFRPGDYVEVTPSGLIRR
jgi:outer membrane lipoprotein SlyB